MRTYIAWLGMAWVRERARADMDACERMGVSVECVECAAYKNRFLMCGHTTNKANNNSLCCYAHKNCGFFLLSASVCCFFFSSSAFSPIHVHTFSLALSVAPDVLHHAARCQSHVHFFVLNFNRRFILIFSMCLAQAWINFRTYLSSEREREMNEGRDACAHQHTAHQTRRRANSEVH